MRRIIARKIYDTATANLIADNTFADGTNRLTAGRATFLYSTPKGAYFALHETCWQGETNRIEPLTLDAAVDLYEDLHDADAIPFEAAFPGVLIEEA